MVLKGDELFYWENVNTELMYLVTPFIDRH